MLFDSCRLRNILEMWKVRSPCNVHKHIKHRRTPLYLLELAAVVGRLGRQRRWFWFPLPDTSRHSLSSVWDHKEERWGPWIHKIKIPLSEKDKKREERLNLKLDFIKNNLNMNHKATIVSLTNLSHSAPPTPTPSLKPFLFPPSFLCLQKEKTRAVRKAC